MPPASEISPVLPGAATLHAPGPDAGARSLADDWRERNEEARWLLDQFPISAQDLVRLGLFANQPAAARFLTKEVERNDLRFYCRMSLKETGRPEYFYTFANLKRDNTKHEVFLWKSLSVYYPHVEELVTGRLVDPETLPDATVRLCGGLEWDWELDTGSVPHTRQKARWRKRKPDSPTLHVVTLGRSSRLENLIRHATDVLKEGYFTTFADLFGNPSGAIWRGLDGKNYSAEFPVDS